MANKEARVSESRWCQDVHVPGFEFVWAGLEGSVALDAVDLNLGGVELGRVIHHEVDLGLNAFHGVGLWHAKV